MTYVRPITDWDNYWHLLDEENTLHPPRTKCGCLILPEVPAEIKDELEVVIGSCGFCISGGPHYHQNSTVFASHRRISPVLQELDVMMGHTPPSGETWSVSEANTAYRSGTEIRRFLENRNSGRYWQYTSHLLRRALDLPNIDDTFRRQILTAAMALKELGGLVKKEWMDYPEVLSMTTETLALKTRIKDLEQQLRDLRRSEREGTR